MNFDFRYLGRSSLQDAAGGVALSFAPNLARPKVFFDSALKHPLRFREAMSALHDVVVGDLKAKPKDRSAWLAWKEQEARREVELRQELVDKAKQAELARIAKEPIPHDLDKQFRKMHRVYWDARVRWANELSRNDPELFRHLVPCDPVVTVAPDVVFFECFSKDESSYGCLSVDRGAFEGAQEAGLGTTNVDYSLALYDHFQSLRSYRQTRLLVDPTGFEVSVAGHADYREEKIDLPPTWLRGFGQIQAAMCLPTTRVEVPVEAVYSILAHLGRHREKTGPRCLRFQLTPGRPPVIVIDPWGIPVVCRGVTWDSDDMDTGPGAGQGGPYRSAPAALGTATQEIKMWGRRRLFALARLLPLADRVEVRLLGSGLPSLWIVTMGEMRFTLALSGWTSNDWTSGSNLDAIAGALHPDARLMDRASSHLEAVRRASFGELAAALGAPSDGLLASLHVLAKQGQVIYDHAAEVYRYRPALPVALSEALLGPEHPELTEGKRLARGDVEILRDEPLSGARRAVVAKVKGTSCEAVLDGDGALKKASCTCSYFYKNRLRAGPCRHLLAVRLHLSGKPLPSVEPPPPVKSAAPLLSVPFPPAILEDMGAAAKAAKKTLGALFEESWDASFERIQAAKSWTEAVQLAGGDGARLLPSREVRDAVERLLPIHTDVLTEIRKVADRFHASPAAVVGLSWLVAKRAASRKR